MYADGSVTKDQSWWVFIVKLGATIIIIIIHSFYIALFSALEQTHCADWHVILNECHP